MPSSAEISLCKFFFFFLLTAIFFFFLFLFFTYCHFLFVSFSFFLLTAHFLFFFLLFLVFLLTAHPPRVLAGRDRPTMGLVAGFLKKGIMFFLFFDLGEGKGGARGGGFLKRLIESAFRPMPA